MCGQVPVDNDRRVEDVKTFSIGLGVALGMIMKKERAQEKRNARKEEERRQREEDIADAKRDHPVAVRNRMFEHMALMKTRRDFRAKQMKRCFPEASDLSSLPVALSQSTIVDEEEVIEEPQKTHLSNGQRISKYY